MRRLLTGHAVTFNLRHHRSGHPFQNRYKSIVCEEAYLLELVRYIHLNPLRAGLVNTIAELNTYPWSCHAVLMGVRELPGQNVHEVLQYFSKRKKLAQEKYGAFVVDGVQSGKREELVDGGIRRVLELAGDDLTIAYDHRILGSGDFVEQLRQEKDVSERLESRLPLAKLIQRVAEGQGCRRQRASSAILPPAGSATAVKRLPKHWASPAQEFVVEHYAARD